MDTSKPTTLSDDDLDALESKAKAAAAVWHSRDVRVISIGTDFIASANPEAILAIIAVLREARATIAKLEAAQEYVALDAAEFEKLEQAESSLAAAQERIKELQAHNLKFEAHLNILELTEHDQAHRIAELEAVVAAVKDWAKEEGHKTRMGSAGEGYKYAVSDVLSLLPPQSTPQQGNA